MTDVFLMKSALALAKKSADEGEVPVGCVIALDGEIVGTGRNRRETVKNALCHAEIEAINEACRTLGGWRLHKCDLFVTLEPCPMCAGAIINARIKRVVFGAADPKNGACGSVVNLFQLPFTHKPQCEKDFMRDECSNILSDFFKDLRKGAKSPSEGNTMERIESFQVDHTKLLKGMYISRTDGDVITYDIRCRRPNIEEVMETGAIHTIEHLFATFVRNSPEKENIIYFGPMGCRTGFYFLTRSLSHEKALKLTKDALSFIAAFDGEVPGVSAAECGNYRDHDLAGAKKEAAMQSEVLKDWTVEKLKY